jgi:SAM-dependent methyltransferase
MSPDLTRGEYLVGLAGVGLVRLHRTGDVSSKQAILAELRDALDHINQPPFDQDMLGEELELEAGYQRWASVYDCPGNPVTEYEQPAVWGLIDELAGEPILDAACGTGRHLAHLVEGGRAAMGVDLNEAMLDRARTKVPRAELRPGDLFALPVEDGSFAGAVCCLALEHVKDLTQAYRELRRAVRPGGWVVVSTTHPTIRSVLGWGAWFIDGMGRGEVPTYAQTVSDHLNSALRAGLTLVHVLEPAIDEAFLKRLPPEEAPIASAAALRGVPVVLVCHYQREDARPDQRHS